ncbi:hypothetical protein IFR05_014014 [Cadophora sp. M221]|nr:hypothetical protein IFR05_014014 [Cadophora sp. M221]
MDNLGHSINYHMTEGSGKSIHQDHRSELLAAIPISENCHVHFWRAIEEFSFDWSAYGEWAAACGRSTWVDSYGDTAVSALLKSWRHGKDNELRIPSMLKKLVEAGADISMRDRHGDTALCIASVRGLRPAVTFLLNLGASIDTCNYEGESIMSKANAELHRAERKGDDKLYAMILSCIIILSDHEKKVT